MFKLFVIVMLCVIALHACAADTSVFLVNTPAAQSVGLEAKHFITFSQGLDVHMIRIPFSPTDEYITRIW